MAAKTREGKPLRELLFPAQCKANGLPEPVPEYLFHPVRNWRFDWAWPIIVVDRGILHGCKTTTVFNPKIALEIEGEIFGRGKPCPACGRKAGGAHSSVRNLLDDMEKYSEAAILGWKVLRCLPKDVDSGAVFDLLKRVLK